MPAGRWPLRLGACSSMLHVVQPESRCCSTSHLIETAFAGHFSVAAGFSYRRRTPVLGREQAIFQDPRARRLHQRSDPGHISQLVPWAPSRNSSSLSCSRCANWDSNLLERSPGAMAAPSRSADGRWCAQWPNIRQATAVLYARLTLYRRFPGCLHTIVPIESLPLTAH